LQTVPTERIHAVNDRDVDPQGGYVLYWMIANRRVGWNFALQRAVEWSNELGKPLLVLEALRCGYRWASDRLHRFIIDGMADNARRLAGTKVRYYPYIERDKGEGKGLLRTLSERAAVVVTDEFPCFMLPAMVAAASRQVVVRMETVDANGIVPLRAAGERVFPTAFAHRRFLQTTLPPYIDALPKRAPLQGVRLPPPPRLPRDVTRRWPAASDRLLAGRGLEELPVDHGVPPAPTRGGEEAAARRLDRFLDRFLDRYADERNSVEADVTSGLSPYLHFGHISSQEVFAAIAEREDWTVDKIAAKADGRRSGWWGMSKSAEAFLDQVITWRELGYNMTFRRDDYDRYESLPEWARRTLDAHARDPREHLYSAEQLEHAQTHDDLWNAAQRQLLREGAIHNYLRMLWGKKILEWTRSPHEALEVMIDLNNRFGLDGRNPNSYSGIFWTLGRYDRPWGPERPIFGKVRYMSSENTARKIRVDAYLDRYAS
jgi:deoxyribodipyrimidine photo-lyase